MKKKGVLIIGLLCEAFACLYVPMKSGDWLMGYRWVWSDTLSNGKISEQIVNIDILRLLAELLAIAFLTTAGYLLGKDNED